MYNSRVQATRQTVAVVTSGLMIYNYQINLPTALIK